MSLTTAIIRTSPKYITIFHALFFVAALLPYEKAFTQVKASEETWSLPTYKVLDSEKAPIFFTKGKYQGASRYIYPNALNDRISDEKVNHDWKALILENKYIKLCVTPEIGGKLYYATDKTNGYNFIYKNNEVKPANIGMTGAWVSGGIEWCVFHHHRASTFLPMDYTLVENEDESKTIYIGETEPRHGMRWTISITVRPGKSYFEAEVSVYNQTPHTNSFLYWANVAAHANEDYQTIFPPSVDLATYHSKVDFTHWPISNEKYRGEDFTEGVDISWWKNVRKSNSFFAHDLQEDFMGGYDHGRSSGTVHIGDHNIVKGAKLWEWGAGARGQNTEGRLTETSGPYVEIMVGAYSDNQPDYTWIKPYETKRWKQYWYPVRDIEGFKNANLNCAVNLEKRENNTVFIGYHSTQELKNARVLLKNGENIVYQKDIEIAPGKAFTKTLELEGAFEATELYTELVNLDTEEVIISYKPKEKGAVDLPYVVEPPKPPTEIATIEEIYLTGKRIEQFYNPSYNALDYYEEILKRDSKDVRTNTTLGRHFLKNGDLPKAKECLSRAIDRLTHDYTRPFSGEALYLQGLTLKALGFYEGAIDTLYRATWDYAYHSSAYFELAQISCIKGDLDKALHEIDESLSTNMKNTRAVALKATILRKMNRLEAARSTLLHASSIDPLNFRIGNETYLIAKESGNSVEAKNALASLTKKMRNEGQNYLNLAIGYLKDGMLDEAGDVLERIISEDPIIRYYRGFIQHEKGKKEVAKNLFNDARQLSEDYCFPYRLETEKILKTALQYNDKDGKAYYYLGNIFYDKDPDLAIEYFHKAVTREPGLAMAYRNLGWGYYRHFKDYNKAISYYEKAVELNGKEAIFYAELDKLYELNNTPVDRRLALFDGKNEVVKSRDDAFVRQITVLTLAGQPEKSVEYLENKRFSYREGTSRVREMIIDARLKLGIKYFSEKDYTKALKEFLEARVPEEEAGSARFGNRNIQVNYFIGQAYESLNQAEEARNYYKLSVEESTSRNIGIMNFYQGMSYIELNEKEKAKKVFSSLIKEGEGRIAPVINDEEKFFSIFGEGDERKTVESMGYALRGLGYKGLGKVSLAKSDLKKAVELSVSNLWASVELNSM